jgi:hypothetical protein
MKVIQYIRPNAIQKTLLIQLDKETEYKAQQLMDKNIKFSLEDLQNRIISLTSENEEEDLIIEICIKDEIEKKLIKLVEKTYEKVIG